MNKFCSDHVMRLSKRLLTKQIGAIETWIVTLNKDELESLLNEIVTLMGQSQNRGTNRGLIIGFVIGGIFGAAVSYRFFC